MLKMFGNCVRTCQAIRESYTTTKPHIAEAFVDQLMSRAKEDSTHVTFEKEHLNAALNKLASDVMKRERLNYEK